MEWNFIRIYTKFVIEEVKEEMVYALDYEFIQ